MLAWVSVDQQIRGIDGLGCCFESYLFTETCRSCFLGWTFWDGLFVMDFLSVAFTTFIFMSACLRVC